MTDGAADRAVRRRGRGPVRARTRPACHPRHPNTAINHSKVTGFELDPLTSLQSPHGAEPIGAQHADRNFVSGHRRPEPGG
jgi:hypothetical protein